MKAQIILLAICISTWCNSQINAYARITGIAGNVLTLSNANTSFDNFLPGEDVIIIQMQGASIGSNTTNASTFGNLSALNSAGLYEVAKISNVNGAVTSMTLSGALINSYSTSGGLQVVSFPKMGANFYTTSANINGVAWDGNVGGVIAFYVNGNLNLFHNISANGIGFRGGSKSGQDGSACDATTFRTSAGDPKFGDKGESIYRTTSTQKSARGKSVNGGGGGNVHNGGGGGGSNFTFGGTGYSGWPTAGCSAATSAGGIGGIAISSSPSRVFMGGGGGGGQENDGEASDGGNGGGVILIKCDTIVVSGACSAVSITSHGNTASPSGQDGAGGGGGAGTIVLRIGGLRVKTGCPLTISADGGDGADVNHWDTHGSGGGGGQGAIYLNSSASFSNTILGTNFGRGGFSSDAPGAPQAGAGGGPANAGVFATTFVSSPLPIELTTFTAIEKEPNVVELLWHTASETNNKKYEIYHSGSQTNWKLIGELAGGGTRSGDAEYILRHFEPQEGLNYYRLKQIDYDGSFNYSPLAYVDITNNKLQIKVYPNPSKGELMLECEQDINSENLTITNSLGEKVDFEMVCIHPGLYKINLKNGHKGMYFLYSQNIHEMLIIE